MKWKDVEYIHKTIAEDSRVDKNTRVQIKYNTDDKKNITIICKVEQFRQYMFEILEENKIIAMAIYIINQQVATQLFRYTAVKTSTESRPLPSNNFIVKNWNAYTKNTRKTLMDMMTRTILEYIDGEQNDKPDATENTKPS